MWIAFYAVVAGVANREAIVKAFHHRADSEHEQILIRVVFVGVVLSFLALATWLGWHSGAADAAASLLSLQRSMLVSFPGMEEAAARQMNLLAGTAGCLFILILGVGLLVRARKRA